MNATQASTGLTQYGTTGQPASATARTEPLMSSATRAVSTYPSQLRLLSAPQVTDSIPGDGAGEDGVGVGLQLMSAAISTASSAIAKARSVGTITIDRERVRP